MSRLPHSHEDNSYYLRYVILASAIGECCLQTEWRIVSRDNKSDIYESEKHQCRAHTQSPWLFRRTTVDRLRPLCLRFVVLTVFYAMARGV